MNILEARRRTLGADVYKKTVQGNPVSVRSLARMRPGLKVFGKSEQFTTTGAQLLDIDSVTQTSTDNSGNILINPNRLSTPKIQNTEYSSIFISGMPSDVSPICAEYDDSDELVKRGFPSKINAYELQADTGKFIITFYKHNNVPVETSELANVMINAGTTALPYEPYTGGKPSPSPDYPQEITSAGDDGSIQVDVTGAQLADISQAASPAGSDYIQVFDTGFEFTYDEQKENSRSVAVPCVLKSGESYIFTAERSHQEIYFYLPETNQFPGWNKTFVPSRDITKIPVYVNQGKPYGTYKVENLMLNAGSTALPYEPYKQPQSLTVRTPNGLPGIPVTSGGNYTDADGQQWICDEVDFKRGKYVQRVKERIYGDDENVSNSGYSAIYTIKQEDADYSAPVLSNMFIYKAYPEDHKDFVSLSDYSDSVVFGLSWIPGKNAEAAKNWFAQKYAEGNPVKVLYALATPIETDLTEEQMQAYESLHTNRPTTVVSATDGAGLELTYKTRKSLEVTD